MNQHSMHGPLGGSDELAVVLEKDVHSSLCQAGMLYTFIH